MFSVSVVLFAVLMTGSWSSGYDSGPKITSTTKKEFVIESNQDIHLTCESNTPIGWATPPVQNGELEITMKAKEHSRYTSYLHLKRAQHTHTGYYTCYSLADDLDKDEVYIYVRNESYPFVNTTSVRFLYVLQYQTAVFDCRPNSPDIKVQLEYNTEEMKLGEDPVDGTVLSYDPKIGFSMQHVNYKQNGLYNCKAGDVSQSILLTVMSHSDSLAKPVITSNREPHPVIEENVTLTCSVATPYGVYFSIDWEIPATSRANEENRTLLSNPVSHDDPKSHGTLRVGTRNLTILNISKEDEGRYTCQVQDHAGNKNNNSKRIIVHDKNVSYIHFKFSNDETIINETVGLPVKWVVELESHPNASLTWYKPDNTSLKPGKTVKYEVYVNPFATKTKLEIDDIKFSDRGIYRLEANNGFQIEIANFTLIVRGKPLVELPLNKSYSLGENAMVTCSAEGYPLPTMKWYFKPCEKMQFCLLDDDFVELPTSNYTTIQENDANIRSTLNIRANISGYLTCSAANSMGTTNETAGFLVSDIKDGEIFNAWAPDLIITGEDVTLHCGATKENYTKDSLHWSKRLPSGERVNVSSLGYQVSRNETKFSYQVKFVIPNIQLNDSGEFLCSVKNIDNEDEPPRHIIVDVKNPEKPKLLSSNINGSELNFRSADTLYLTCSFDGIPPPVVRWYKDDVALQGPKYKISENGESLTVPFIKTENEGKYECRAVNKAGVTKRQVTVTLKDKPGPNVSMIATIIVGIILIVLVAILILKVRKERKLQHELKMAGLKTFEEGAMESLNPELPVDDQAELLPYDKKWEFPRSKLKLGKQLGAGAFGVVMKAEAYGIVEGEPVTTVAVKMVKRNAEFTYVKALASELKIMVHLGKHLNVVNLLGACTNNIAKRELYVIVEYCRYGNLHNYLLRHRENFIDQVDPKTGCIDSLIGAEILSRADSINNKARITYAALSFSNSGDSARDNMAVDYRTCPMGNQTSDGSNADVNISMSPTGEDACLMSNNSAQPEWRSNYRGDYRGSVRPICTRDLVCWAFQIARGMEYLAGRKVLHGDLAARNILLADQNIVKICDFGLAKSMYKSDNYKKKGDGPLPIKWMAIESIRDRVFSTQSDVWSFGIVLWELFSLARTPYPGMEADEKLYNKLLSGYRMEKPPYATDDIYNTMQKCWHANPDCRPSFSDLSVSLGKNLEESVRKLYIELNDPYINMNEQWLQDNGNDYLSMMTAPTYNNLVAPNIECDSGYINSPLPMNPGEVEETSGYLCMKSTSNASSPNIFSPRIVTVGDTVFDFSTPTQRRHPREEQDSNGPESHPILKMSQGSESDSDYLNDLKTEHPEKTNPSFSNPSYHALATLNPSSDNYISMPQHKAKPPKDNDLNHINEKLPYITAALSNEDKISNLRNPFSSPKHPVSVESVSGNGSYVNFPL